MGAPSAKSPVEMGEGSRERERERGREGERGRERARKRRLSLQGCVAKGAVR